LLKERTKNKSKLAAVYGCYKMHVWPQYTIFLGQKSASQKKLTRRFCVYLLTS